MTDYVPMDQDNLAAMTVELGPGVEDAPYYVVPASDCDGCYPNVLMTDYDGPLEEDACAACFKCCSCERCDRHKNRAHYQLFACPACGCRVWSNGCAPYQCLCIKGCDCRCCGLGDMDMEIYEYLETWRRKDKTWLNL